MSAGNIKFTVINSGEVVYVKAVDTATNTVYSGKKDLNGLIYSVDKYVAALNSAIASADVGGSATRVHVDAALISIIIDASGLNDDVTSFIMLPVDSAASIAELRRELAAANAFAAEIEDEWMLKRDRLSDELDKTYAELLVTKRSLETSVGQLTRTCTELGYCKALLEESRAQTELVNIELRCARADSAALGGRLAKAEAELLSTAAQLADARLEIERMRPPIGAVAVVIRAGLNDKC